MKKTLKTIKNDKGFTLVELILVITILGILSVMAMPSFIHVTEKANTAAVEGVVGAVNSAIGIKKIEWILAGNDMDTFDPVLETGNGTDSDMVFEGVLSHGLSTVGDSYWRVTAGGIYIYLNGSFQKRFKLEGEILVPVDIPV